MSAPSNTVIIAGVGQTLPEPDIAKTTYELAIEAIDRCLSSSQGEQVRSSALARGERQSISAALDAATLDAVVTVDAGPKTASVIAESIGASHARCFDKSLASTTAHEVFAGLVQQVAAGEIESALIVGSHSHSLSHTHSHKHSRSHKHSHKNSDYHEHSQQRHYTEPGSEQSAEVNKRVGFGGAGLVRVGASHIVEQLRGIWKPVTFYSLFESRVRWECAETIEDHRRRIAKLWQNASAVANRNIYAWPTYAAHSFEQRSWQSIINPQRVNPLVAFPYTRTMTPNNGCSGAVAILLCSPNFANRFSVPDSRRIYPQVAISGCDEPVVSHRKDLTSSRVLEVCRTLLADRFGLDVQSFKYVDLDHIYPSAVQIAAAELGFSLRRPLTLTGGQSFAGRMGGIYPLTAIVSLVEKLWNDQGQTGLISSVGGVMARHTVGVYSTQPPNTGFTNITAQEVHQMLRHKLDSERVSLDGNYVGDVEIEAYSAMYNHRGFDRLYCSLITPDGSRTWGHIKHFDSAFSMLEQEAIGRRVHLRSNGQIVLRSSTRSSSGARTR